MDMPEQKGFLNGYSGFLIKPASTRVEDYQLFAKVRPVQVGVNSYDICKSVENVFKIGYHRSEVTVIFGQNNPDFMSDLHFCLGKRIENVKYNFAGFVGLARCVGLLDSSTKFTSPGIYAEIQATKKIFFDIGYGLTLYANYNKSYPIVGLRLDLFFSNSYRRKKFN